jgi:transcriptional regulator with XRE-family HTH domain
MDATDIWKNIKTEIKRAKSTQKKLAEKTGISLGNIQQQIHHNRIPDAIEIFIIAKALHTSVEHLVNGEETGNELKLLDGFRQLDERDQLDVMGNIEMKLERTKGVKSGDKSADKQSESRKGRRAQGKGA